MSIENMKMVSRNCRRPNGKYWKEVSSILSLYNFVKKLVDIKLHNFTT